MDFQDVDLAQIAVDFEAPKSSPIRYQGNDLVIKFPEDTKITVQSLYRQTERVAVDEKGNYYTEEMLEEIGEFVATCKVSGAFRRFLLDLYQRVAQILYDRDRYEGVPFPWKDKLGLRFYTHLRHFLGMSERGLNLLCIKTNYANPPTAFCVSGLNLKQHKATFILETR